MEMKNVIVSIVLGLVILVVGGFLGALYQIKLAAPKYQTQVMQQTPQILTELSSSLVPSVAAHGTVSNISGENITLTSGASMMTFVMGSTVKIYSLTPASTSVSKAAKASVPASTVTLTSLQNIKVGNNLTVNFKVLPDGQIQAINAVITPSTTLSATK